MRALMTLPLKDQINACKNIHQLNEIVNKLQVNDIKTRGGRRFSVPGEKGTVALNDIVKKIGEVFDAKETLPEYNEVTRKTIEKIREINAISNLNLKDKLPLSFPRILTAIRSFFGNLGFNRNKVLDNISKTVEEHLKKNKETSPKKPFATEIELNEETKPLDKLSVKQIIDTIKIDDKKLLTDTDTALVNRQTQLNISAVDVLKTKFSDALKKNDMGPIEEAFRAVNKGDHKIDLIALTIAQCFRPDPYDRNRKPLAVTAELIEKLPWNPEIKEALLPTIYSELLSDVVSIQKGYYAAPGGEAIDQGNNFHTYSYVVDTRKLFGRGDHTQSPIIVSEYMGKGFAQLMKSQSEAIVHNLVEGLKNGKDPKSLEFGLEISIGQFVECRFPTSMISPFLPYLQNIPGLIKLEISDVGVRNPWDKKVQNASSLSGYGDNDAKDLLSIIKTNPHLLEFQVDIGNMTPQKAKEFFTEWGEILQDQGHYAQAQLELKNQLLQEVT